MFLHLALTIGRIQSNIETDITKLVRFNVNLLCRAFVRRRQRKTVFEVYHMPQDLLIEIYQVLSGKVVYNGVMMN